MPPNKSMTRLLTLIIACTLFTVSVCAQDETGTTGLISGRIINENGQGVAGATIFLRRITSGSPTRNTISDSEGNFRVNGLDQGVYTINATAPAYVYDIIPGPTPTYYRLGDTVQLRMVRGGVLTGRVTNASGDPVIGVRVRMARVRDARGQLSKLPSNAFFEQPTDDRGVYRIYGIAPGGYVVSAGGGTTFNSMFNPYDSDIPTYSPAATRADATEITIQAGEEVTADIRYRGEPGHSISGTVNVAGNGGATITLSGGNISMPLASAFQSAGGGRTFSFNGLPDGEYKLIAQEVTNTPAPGAIPLFAMSDIKVVTVKGANVAGVELLTKPLGSMSGRVVLEPAKFPECEGKRPPSFAEIVINVQRNEKELAEEDPIYQRFVGSVDSPDAKGAFALRNLRPGRYRLEPRFYARYWYLRSITKTTAGAKPQKLDLVTNQAVLKHGEQLNNVTITLAEGAASVRGRVALAEGTAVPANAVYLLPVEPAKVDDVLRYFVTDVAADGAFAFNSVAPGKYLILAQVNTDPQLTTSAKLRQSDAAASRTKLRHIAESQQTEIELKPCQNLADYQLKQ